MRVSYISFIIFRKNYTELKFCLVDGASIVKGPEMVCEMSRHPYTLPDLETDQCDAFLRCEKGLITQELCEDGLVYHMSDNLCDMPQRVDCSGRSRLQPPKGFYSFPKRKLSLIFLKFTNLNIKYIRFRQLPTTERPVSSLRVLRSVLLLSYWNPSVGYLPYWSRLRLESRSMSIPG